MLRKIDRTKPHTYHEGHGRKDNKNKNCWEYWTEYVLECGHTVQVLFGYRLSELEEVDCKECEEQKEFD